MEHHARMAELVDALVSNTSGAIRAGSIPAPGTKKPFQISERAFSFHFVPKLFTNKQWTNLVYKMSNCCYVHLTENYLGM